MHVFSYFALVHLADTPIDRDRGARGWIISRKRKVTLAELPQGDFGPATDMQRKGATINKVRADNGAWFLRKRREHAALWQ